MWRWIAQRDAMLERDPVILYARRAVDDPVVASKPHTLTFLASE